VKITTGGGILSKKALSAKLRSSIGILGNKLFYALYDLSGNDEQLRLMKDKYKGKRCFLIGGGPSMDKINVSLLKGEYTAGLNMLYTSGIKTTFYFICGYKILWDKGKDVIKQPNLFLGTTAGRWFLKNMNDFPDANTPYILKDRGEISVWNNVIHDITKGVRGGNGVSFVALQVLLYMGFKEIYLLGHDCDYSGDKQYFFKNISVCTERPWDKLFKNYEIVKKEFERKKCHIYNATPGGKLEVFDRVKLEEVLG